MTKGDIILITFPFTDLSGSKLRPALVLAQTDTDVTVNFITTQLKWQAETDVLLNAEKNNGLKKTSLIRVSKIATLDKQLVQGRLGSASREIMREVGTRIMSYLQLM